MAYPLDRRLLLPTYLCFYMFLTTCTLRSAALSFNYNFSNPADLDSAELNCINDCYRDRAAGRLILTNATGLWRTGWVIHKQLVPLWDDGVRKKASFNTTFDFVINGNFNNQRGDGMAFFIGPQDRPTDARGGFLGLINNPDNLPPPPRTVGVEFDTNRNKWDPPPPCADHIGIDVNSINSTSNECLPNVYLFGNMRATITYDADSGKMEATLIRQPADSNPTPYTVRTAVNLKDAGVPQQAAIGFSAATGDLTESHELLSWSFESFNSTGRTVHKTRRVLAITLPIAAAILIFIVACVCFWSRRRPAERKPSVAYSTHTDDILSIDSLLFDLATLRAATDNFSESNKLGEGGFGAVYKGVLSEGQEIAVKRLSQSSRQGIEELKTELVLVAKLHHKNLVRLVGVCLEEHEKLLVYEYMPNRSLDTVLFDSEKSKDLDWGKRFEIVNGVARGLQYLHEDSQLRIVHRDLKASNVLLDLDYSPKISDFGLAKLFGWDQSQGITSHIAGTYGYMSPEYAMRGQYSAKSDAFSFGVLVLEIVTGRKNSIFTNAGQSVDLLSLVWEHWTTGTIEELLDPSLGGRSPGDQMLRLVNIGLLCVQDSPADRPTMSAVIVMLSSNTVSLKGPSRSTFCIQDGEMAFQSINDNIESKTMSHNEVSITELEPR